VPLLDHFRPPLREERHWEGFHSRWANAFVDALNEHLLPPGYYAEANIHFGANVEIDAATFQRQSPAAAGKGPATATLPARVWTPPAATLILPIAFPETFEVRVLSTEAGPTLVAAVELVSPSNKERAEHRRTFALKCASYLVQGVGLIVVDIVTSRHFNLHDEMARLLPGGDSFLFPASPPLYAAAYRPVRRGEADLADSWLVPLAVGQSLPSMPLALMDGPCLPVDLDAAYAETCRKLRLTGDGH
jgi:hypothetical protein